MKNPSSGLTYSIQIAENRKYIEIILEGHITRADAMKYVVESHKIAAKEGISKFLLNALNARNTESVGNNYDFAYKDLKEEKNLLRGARIAMLVEENDHSHDFVETVAINSGENVRMFRDRADALKFLDV